MIGRLKVSPEQMQASAAELSGYIRDMEECFQAIKRTLDGTGNYWTGEGRDAHYKLYANEKSFIDEFLARCTEHVTDLNTMAGVYSEAERAATAKAEELPAMQF